MIPIWKFLPAPLAHDWAPVGLRLAADLFSPQDCTWHPFKWKGLQFSSRLGIAGGVDKNADLYDVWPRLGFGFAEYGTITPKPQGPNSGKILDRNWNEKLLWNRMGFPNEGQFAIRAKLECAEKSPIPVFLNVGKNRDTSVEKAADDYVETTAVLQKYADVFVINISSPNTQNLRALQSEKFIGELVAKVKTAADKKPILVKFSPDEAPSELEASLDIAAQNGADGFILTNTTLKRPSSSTWPELGGLSGQFLKSLSEKSLHIATQHFKNSPTKPLLISAGGVLSPEDVAARLDLGADLVQVYSALVFSGPGFARQTAQFFQQKRPSP